MADDKKFDIKLDELVVLHEEEEEKKLRVQVFEAAGDIVSKVKKIADSGDLNTLRLIQTALNSALNPTRPPRTDRPARSEESRREQNRPDPTPAPAVEDDTDVSSTQARGVKNFLGNVWSGSKS